LCQIALWFIKIVDDQLMDLYLFRMREADLWIKKRRNLTQDGNKSIKNTFKTLEIAHTESQSNLESWHWILRPLTNVKAPKLANNQVEKSEAVHEKRTKTDNFLVT
jgi:hypothetical protein